MIFDRTNLMELLYTNVVEVTFTKKNGEERIMKCTLKNDVIENVSNTVPSTTKMKKINEDIIPVYDLEKNEWRSFRVDSVKTITYKG